MKTRFHLFQCNGVYYSVEIETGKQHSLRTKDKAAALTLLHSKNEAHRQPILNLQIARTYLSTVRAGDRATEFASRCRQLEIKGVTLHSYRYAWAERARVAGMPERFAQEALGHNSKAVHRAYAKRALVKVPSLEEYEAKAATQHVAKAA